LRCLSIHSYSTCNSSTSMSSHASQKSPTPSHPPSVRCISPWRYQQRASGTWWCAKPARRAAVCPLLVGRGVRGRRLVTGQDRTGPLGASRGVFSLRDYLLYTSHTLPCYKMCDTIQAQVSRYRCVSCCSTVLTYCGNRDGSRGSMTRPRPARFRTRRPPTPTHRSISSISA
jgi:hypothetical protein